MKQNIILCDCNVSEIEEFKRGLENNRVNIIVTNLGETLITNFDLSN